MTFYAIHVWFTRTRIVRFVDVFPTPARRPCIVLGFNLISGLRHLLSWQPKVYVVPSTTGEVLLFGNYLGLLIANTC